MAAVISCSQVVRPRIWQIPVPVKPKPSRKPGWPQERGVSRLQIKTTSCWSGWRRQRTSRLLRALRIRLPSLKQTLHLMRVGGFRRSLCRKFENQGERFACERITSLSDKSVNQSEYFPMARHFRTDRLTAQREMGAKSHSRHVVMVDL